MKPFKPLPVNPSKALQQTIDLPPNTDVNLLASQFLALGVSAKEVYSVYHVFFPVNIKNYTNTEKSWPKIPLDTLKAFTNTRADSNLINAVDKCVQTSSTQELLTTLTSFVEQEITATFVYSTHHALFPEDDKHRKIPLDTLNSVINTKADGNLISAIANRVKILSFREFINTLSSAAELNMSANDVSSIYHVFVPPTVDVTRRTEKLSLDLFTSFAQTKADGNLITAMSTRVQYSSVQELLHILNQAVELGMSASYVYHKVPASPSDQEQKRTDAQTLFEHYQLDGQDTEASLSRIKASLALLPDSIEYIGIVSDQNLEENSIEAAALAFAVTNAEDNLRQAQEELQFLEVVSPRISIQKTKPRPGFGIND